MKYNHIVIANGKWYPAGADVPVEDAKTEKVEVEKKTTPKQTKTEKK